ncbi:cholesterol oxidase substrate-binding domain-containing protein [Streptomyces sp. JJ38]|uniref:cholesterol oxidase substrate-binding domain-containing protein n=1 Tax=Streptomyces sp. JJ38 TaxID=2738128 RepID=UPI001C57AAD0|nr:cholesterol oxidase substrate-binding domain-containing protein [Streptomyces sp. JJ38]MBW1599298.1 FAD-binding protein [Streptomyces sp. JJ38]
MAVGRRRVLAASAAALAATGWRPAGAVAPGSAHAVGAAPPGLPDGVEVYQRVYRNWSGEIRADALWTCAPRGPEEVRALADWAADNGWRLRMQGFRHTWAPLTVADGAPAAGRVLMLDTRRHLTGLRLLAPNAVRVGAGNSMEELLEFLGRRGLGVTACPAPGALTVGGALAVGGHGTAVPAAGEVRAPGHGYGSLSNQVVSLTAVVWDRRARGGRGGHVVREFHRSESGTAALLAHLGRAAVVDVVLRVGADETLRCVSRLDIPATRLFAPEAGSGRTFADLLDADGRVEAIWFAFTSHPWVKVWSRSPHRPLGSRRVDEPYNYPFSDRVPEPVARLAAELIEGRPELAPLFGRLQFLIAKVALTGDISDVLLSGGLLRELLTGELLEHLLAGGLRSDLWGPSRFLLHYVRPSTLRVTTNGYAVLVRRADVQWALSRFHQHYERLLTRYRERGAYPVNGAVEVRASGLDVPAWCEVPGARPPSLSPLTPDRRHPEWDTALWLNVLSLPGTPTLPAFYRDLERALLGTFDGTRAGLRVEWSKSWAHTEDAAWADPDVLGRVVPASLPAWSEAVDALDHHDPHRVFSAPLLDELLR